MRGFRKREKKGAKAMKWREDESAKAGIWWRLKCKNWKKDRF
jgi:hypothetical protein